MQITYQNKYSLSKNGLPFNKGMRYTTRNSRFSQERTHSKSGKRRLHFFMPTHFSKLLRSLIHTLLNKRKWNFSTLLLIMLLIGAYSAVRYGQNTFSDTTSHAKVHVQVEVQDADSFTTVAADKTVQRYRLYGIDAPEYNQPFGNTAKKFSAALLQKNLGSIKSMGIDQYGRHLVILTLPDGDTLNERLVREGLAHVYTQFCVETICQQWKQAETLARKEKKGVWSQKKVITPWNWRKNKGH